MNKTAEVEAVSPFILQFKGMKDTQTYTGYKNCQ